MVAIPSRSRISVERVVSAALGAAALGLAEAQRALGATRLFVGDGDVVTLLALGALSGAVVGALAALVLLPLPARPLGRERWGGVLWGAWAWAVTAAAITWFTDPPPFTDPFPGQGNVPAFAGLVALSLVVALALYQGIRGAGRVAGAVVALAAGLAVWVWSAADPQAVARSAPPSGAPNVLLVTLDTTRADHVHAYGADVDTPAFDRVAAEGALFQSASAVAAVTGPSHASMLSGAGPWDHQVLLNGVPVPPEFPMLGEVLHDHGWATAAFVSAYVLDGNLGFRRGFSVYDDDFGAVKGASLLMPVRLLAMARRHGDPDEVLERRGDHTVDQALAWLKQRPDGAWFLWVHLFDAHGPYTPPAPFDERYYSGDRKDPANTSMQQVKDVAAYLEPSLAGVTDVNWVFAQYSGEVSYADAQLGRLLSAIDTQDTLVAVIGDHGESLGEHGVWFNHGDDVYETSVHVPFAVRWPGRVPAGQVVTAPVQGNDLAPTLLGLVGVEPPKSMTGRPALRADGQPGDRVQAQSMCFDRAANQAERAAGRITKPKYRMVGLRGPASRYVQRELGGEREYFDLSHDPKGLLDLRAGVEATPEGAELLSILKGQADGLLGADTSRSAAAQDAMSEEERQRLEALGYLEQ